jgi:hypothetical protein
MATFSNLKSSAVGTTAVTLDTVTEATIITGCNLTNIIGSSASVSLYVQNGGTSYYILKDRVVEGGKNLEAITGNKIVLVNGDALKVISSAEDSFDVIVSTLDGI